MDYPELDSIPIQLESQPNAVPELSQKELSTVLRIISPESLRDQLQQLDARYESMPRSDQRLWAKKFTNAKEFHGELEKIRRVFSHAHTVLSISPILGFCSDPFLLDNFDQAATAAVLRASEASKIMPALTRHSLATDISSYALHWERCRSYMVLYDFVQKALPNITRNIFTYLENKGSLNTSSLFCPENPLLLAPLAHHIYRYVTARSADYTTWRSSIKQTARTNDSRSENPKTKLKKRRQKIKVDDVEIFVTSTPLREIPREIVTSLFPKAKTASTYFIAPVACNPACVREESEDCFSKTIISLFITPYLQEITDLPNICRISALDRCVVRGAVISRIVNAVGSEYICASREFANLINKPYLLFDGKLSREDSLWSAIRKDEEATLRPLDEFLKEHIPEDGISKEAEYLADFIRHHFLELQLGRYISEAEFYRNWVPSKVSSLERKPGRGKMMAEGRVVHSKLLPNGGIPHFGVLGLILRESLNKARGWKTVHEKLARSLEGLRPYDGRSVAGFDNPDHWNPIRHKTFTAELVEIKLPGHRLTGRAGISNLLTFMGTGQGYKTSAFLHLSDAKNAGDADGFFSSTVEECLKLFEQAVQLNTEFMEQKGDLTAEEVWQYAGEEKYGSQEGFIQISDQKVWGEPNQLLTARPLKRNGLNGYMKLSRRQKLETYWTKDVQDKWVEFLGPLYGKDPIEYSGNCPSFSSTLEFIQRLDLDGFRTGLTSFQTTVNICFKGICLTPSIDELADFIGLNSGLGAYNGLVDMGFSLSNRSEIKCALQIVCSHLERFLSVPEKEMMGFVAHPWIVIEHDCCKTARYSNRVDSMTAWAKEAEEDGNWVEDRVDSTSFPIPLVGCLEDVERIIGLYSH